MPDSTTQRTAPSSGCLSLGDRPAFVAGRAPGCNTLGAPGTSHRAAAVFRWMRRAVTAFLIAIMGGGTGLGLIAQAQTGPVPPMTSGGLVVVHDAGPGVPTGALMSFGIADDASPEVSPLIQFPVRSPGLRPGTLRGNPAWPYPQWMVHPLFLVGDDTRSTSWLKANRERLAAMGATGIVVRANTGSDFLRIRALSGGLPMAPAPAVWLGEQLMALGASVVPLLILPDGRITQAVPVPISVPSVKGRP